MKKKRTKARIFLDEVFSKSEKSPKWKAAYAKADVEVKLAVQIAKAREKARPSWLKRSERPSPLFPESSGPIRT